VERASAGALSFFPVITFANSEHGHIFALSLLHYSIKPTFHSGISSRLLGCQTPGIHVILIIDSSPFMPKSNSRIQV
jgi:hypothetical protein